MRVEFIKAKPSPARPSGFFAFWMWALFGNADDGPYGDEKWRAGRAKTFRLALEWWFRNPAHNLCFYVIGHADRDHVFSGEKNWGVDPGLSIHWCIYQDDNWKEHHRILISYVGKKRGWYIGCRPCGAFGISLNFAKKE